MKATNTRVLLCALVLSVLVASCAPAATPTPQIITKVETKVVEKEVVKEVTAVPAPAVVAPTGKPIKIVAVLSMTGLYTYLFDLIGKGCLMAAEEANETGGILGRPVYTIVRDDGSEPKLAVTLAHELCDDADIVAVYGTGMSATQVPMGPVLHECRIPMVPHAYSTLVTAEGLDNVFQATPNAKDFGAALADAMYELSNVRSVAILYEQDPANENYAQGFRGICAKRNIRITSDQPITKDTVDFRPMLTMIKSQAPDAVFAASFYMKALIVKQMRELGMKQVYGATELTNDAKEFVQSAGEAAVGALSTADVGPLESNPAAVAFRDRFTARWGVPPEPTVYATYQNYCLILDAIKRAGSTDREAVIKALRESNYEGIVYPVSFNPDGTAKTPGVWIYRLQPDLTFSKEFWRWDKPNGKLIPVQ